MTANASNHDQQACRAAGMNGFVSKPLTVQGLVGELERVLKPHRELISLEILENLQKAIGTEGKIKVIQAYLKGTSELKLSLKNNSAEVDLDSLQKIGHRYKSSSATVGAMGLAYLFKSLEHSKDSKVSQTVLAQIWVALEIIERKLEQIIKEEKQTDQIKV
jgi:HPt (histidine-containing phosphotransfer) domain-containing protein